MHEYVKLLNYAIIRSNNGWLPVEGQAINSTKDDLLSAGPL